jgi:hypothetical protein
MKGQYIGTLTPILVVYTIYCSRKKEKKNHGCAEIIISSLGRLCFGEYLQYSVEIELLLSIKIEMLHRWKQMLQHGGRERYKDFIVIIKLDCKVGFV